MDPLLLYIESLIFAAESPISLKEIQISISEAMESDISTQEIEDSVDILTKKYHSNDFSFEIVRINNGLTFMTKAAYQQVVGNHLKQLSQKRLSKAALECLAIIAYKQPVTRVEVESIRGVNCDYTLQKLLEKELVSIDGRSDAPGRPLIFTTSEKFMDYFGLNDVKDLPKLKDFQTTDNQVGQQAPIEDDVLNIASEEE